MVSKNLTENGDQIKNDKKLDRIDEIDLLDYDLDKYSN